MTSRTRTDASKRYFLVRDWPKLPEGVSYGDASGVAVGADRIYVLTRHPATLLVLDPEGRLVSSWGEGRFTERTHGISIAPEGDGVFITDDGDHTVKKFTFDGELLMSLGTSGKPSETGYDGKHLDSIRGGGEPFNRPTNVAFGSRGEIFVTDGYGNARVHKFSARGELLNSWGEPGSRPSEFRLVHGITVLPDGRLLVADRENDRIQIFDSSGVYMSQWTDVQRPTQVAFDPAHQVLAVSELGWRDGQRSFVHGPRPNLPSRVTILGLDGTVLDRWGGRDAEAPGSFIAAHDVAFDSVGNLYVAEVSFTIGVSHGLASVGCHTLQKFAPR